MLGVSQLFIIEGIERAKRVLRKRDGIHRVVRVPQSHGVKRLTDQRQRRHAGDIRLWMFGHRRADGNAVSEQRKSQPSDQPHPCQLREKHFACVVDEHADAGDQPKQSAVLIGFDLRGAKKAVEHVGDSFFDETAGGFNSFAFS